MPALGLTDHGVLNGAVEFYKACSKHGVKPIIGLEAYLADDRPERDKVKYERNHLTLLARDEAGLQQPDQALVGGLPGGLPARPGERRHGADRAPLRGPDRAHRLPSVALLPAARRRSAGETRAPTSTT